MTLPCGPNHSKVESQLCPFAVPPDELAGTRFAMFQTFFQPPTWTVFSMKMVLLMAYHLMVSWLLVPIA